MKRLFILLVSILFLLIVLPCEASDSSTNAGLSTIMAAMTATPATSNARGYDSLRFPFITSGLESAPNTMAHSVISPITDKRFGDYYSSINARVNAEVENQGIRTNGRTGWGFGRLKFPTNASCLFPTATIAMRC